MNLVLDMVGDGFCDWDLRTGNLHTNARYHRMLGFDEGAPGAPSSLIADNVHPDDRPALEEFQSSVLPPGNDEASADVRLRHKDGHFVWLRCRCRVTERDTNGKPARIVGLRTDISENKELEHQLLEAQKMESVGRLTCGVAHDFNNHLTIINGYVELLQMRVPSRSEIAVRLRAVRAAGDRAAALTRQLLAVSRAQTRAESSIDVNVLVEEMHGMLQRLIGENIAVDMQLERGLRRVTADPAHIEQIVMNLVVNARDAILNRGRVIIRTAQTDGHVKLSVIDDGAGIEPEVQRRMFEPFYTTKGPAHGTGLGLSTVSTIVRNLGGSIDVETARGSGSSFHILLPAGDAAAFDLAIVGPAAPAQGGTETILLVEDHEPLRAVLTDILRHYGYRVLAALDIADAVELAASYPSRIHLLLTDVIMPDGDGLELVLEIRARRPEIKVLCVSGYPMERADDLTRLGASFLSKPCPPDALAARIRELLG